VLALETKTKKRTKLVTTQQSEITKQLRAGHVAPYRLVQHSVRKLSEWVELNALPDHGRPPPMTQPPSFSSFCLLPLYEEGPGISAWENVGIKDACTRVLEHFRHKHQHNYLSGKFCPPLTSLFLSPEDFRDAFSVAGVPL